jgi:hypothetical protein
MKPTHNVNPKLTKKATCYVLVEVTIQHKNGVNPNDVLNECDYNFRYDGDDAMIVNTELLEYYDEYPDY